MSELQTTKSDLLSNDLESMYKRVVDIHQSPPNTQVIARGWVKTRRNSKEIQFVQLSDGSCFQDIQIIFQNDKFDSDTLKKVTTGACIEVHGDLIESPAAGQNVEIQARGLSIYGEADQEEYPLQKKGASFEFLREIAHLRCRTNTFGAVSRVRSEVSWAVHQYFRDRKFQYVHTPIITASDCEGAGEMFAVSTNLTHETGQYVLKDQDPAQDFFAKPAFLTVSGQLEAETLALGLTNVYTFGPTFRAENSNSARHLAEFWMIEPEMAFCDLKQDMNLACDFLQNLIKHVLNYCPQDLEFFQKRIEPDLIQTLEHVAHAQFEYMTYSEAIKHLKDSDEHFEYPVEWGCDLQSEHERWLTEKKVGRPVVLYDYPKDIKAFYMRLNDDDKTVAAMDVLVPKIGEIIGGSQREERLDVLKAKMKSQDLSEDVYWWYLDLRRFGSAPHAGFGLGLERFIMYVTGMKNIRDVIPYYRCPRNVDF